MLTMRLHTLLLLTSLAVATQAQPTLQSTFQNPPNAARPRVWWHWMNGNVTKNGIQKDLEWMERVGIGGFQNFDANLFTPQVVEKKLVFMTPEWKEAFRWATQLADQKGLEMAIAGSPGWSVTGGPWVPAEDGMKKYVWSETRVSGGQTFSGRVPTPPTTTGPTQNVPIGTEMSFSGATKKLPEYYADAFVVAYRLPDADLSMAQLRPKVTSSGGSFTWEALSDGDLYTKFALPPGAAAGDEIWVQYELAEPHTIRAVTVAGANTTMMADFNGGPLNRFVQVSDDGKNWREIAAIPGSTNPQNTVSFAPVRTRFVRLVVRTLESESNGFAAMFGAPVTPPHPIGIDLAEFVLHTSDRIDQFEDKAGFRPWKEDLPTFQQVNAVAIPLSDVVDLTSKMQADGALTWAVPPGQWVIVRLGYSLTGRENHPASPEATGLEVDKLDAQAVRKYINAYLDMYQSATDGLMGQRGLTHLILDSYEAGHMNWSKDFPAEFERRRGYSLIQWVPALTGRTVQNTSLTEQFLWDFRKTIGELIVENHYEVIGEELAKRGMRRYTESHEDKRIYLADGMDVKRKADIPMSAMWTPGSLAGGSDEEVRSEADIRESASVAHLYGKPIVAAESMTSIQNAFSWTPEKLKRTADLEMANGLNRFVIHTSVHQPLDDRMPGFSLGPFGQYFTRHETWGEQARPWIDYLSRSCHLLQQGQFVADALVLYGENTNLTWRFREKLPEIPGYEYDFVNSTALLDIIRFENGRLRAPGGGTYSVLVLDESAKMMTLPVLKKIRDLAKAGAKITGVRPEKSPSLADDPIEYKRILAELYTYPNVSSTRSAAEVLQAQGIAEDVKFAEATTKIRYVHRQTTDSEIYWLGSRSAESGYAEVSFRVSGKIPERWHPQTGKTEKIDYEFKNGRTIVPLRFEPWEAFFIVFREPTTVPRFVSPSFFEKEKSTLGGSWKVFFQENRGGPTDGEFGQLLSWPESSNPRLKYFSGTAAYHNAFKIKRLRTGERIFLDLGDVKNVAEVIVNGQNMGILWKTPFKMDITEAVKTGKNTLEIRVTNTWVNRLIGDAQPGATDKITFTTMPFYPANSPLLPSGLLGPVRVLSRR
jgi:hypothetical protein